MAAANEARIGSLQASAVMLMPEIYRLLDSDCPYFLLRREAEVIRRLKGAEGGKEMMATPTPPWSLRRKITCENLSSARRASKRSCSIGGRCGTSRRASMLRLPLRKIEPRS